VRVVHRVLYVLAALVFVAPAIYLAHVWPRNAPPALTEFDRARVEANIDSYRVTLPSGARYELARSDVNGRNKRGAAVAMVRSQLHDEYVSYRHLWARFWFLLAGAFGVAMLLTFVSQLISGAVASLAETAHP
jgi:hypothetical protein